MTTRVELTLEQLPEQLRPLLADYHAKQRQALDAHQALSRAGIQDKPKLSGPAEEAARDAAEAHTALLEATREHPTEMRQYSHAKFMAAVERAREHLAAAEAELRTAAGHAAVFAAVRDGRPTLNVERGAEGAGRKRAMYAAGVVRDASGSLPDAIDG